MKFFPDRIPQGRSPTGSATIRSIAVTRRASGGDGGPVRWKGKA